MMKFEDIKQALDGLWDDARTKTELIKYGQSVKVEKDDNEWAFEVRNEHNEILAKGTAMQRTMVVGAAAGAFIGVFDCPR